MYKIISVILFGLVVCDAGATTMCAQDDKVVIGLNYATAPTSYVADNEKSEWRVHYDGIGTISGISSCANFFSDLDKCPYNGSTGWFYYSACPFAQSGYDAKSNYQGRRDGQRCWCKITRPFESEWVTIWLYGADCPTKCAEYCASAGLVDNYSSFRYGVFGVIGMDDDYTVSFK
jgi:hypothetical protein